MARSLTFQCVDMSAKRVGSAHTPVQTSKSGVYRAEFTAAHQITPVSPPSSPLPQVSPPSASASASASSSAARMAKVMPTVAEGKGPSQTWRTSAWRRGLSRAYEHGGTQAVLGAFLVVALFLTDIWVLARVESAGDVVLDAILFVILLSFAIEVVVQCLCEDKYLGGFFFWMDILGTVSLVLDVSFLLGDVLNNLTANVPSGAVLRAARAAKLGAKAGRLTRIIKLFKMLSVSGGKKGKVEKVGSAKQISEKLGGVLSRRVAALTMLLVICYPLMSIAPVDNSPRAWGASIAASSSGQVNGTVAAMETWFSTSGAGYNRITDASWSGPVVGAGGSSSGVVEWKWSKTVGNTVASAWSVPSVRVRENNCVRASHSVASTVKGVAAVVTKGVVCFEGSSEAIEEAAFGLASMIFVIAVLLGFSWSFGNSLQTLMVQVRGVSRAVRWRGGGGEGGCMWVGGLGGGIRKGWGKGVGVWDAYVALLSAAVLVETCHGKRCVHQ